MIIKRVGKEVHTMEKKMRHALNILKQWKTNFRA